MTVKDIIDENFQDYKKAAMLLASAACDWKCCKEAGVSPAMCQNSQIASQPSVQISDEVIVQRYLDNPITEAVIVAGLEPFLQSDELISLVSAFRKHTDDDIVIYTGYYPNEIDCHLCRLSKFKNDIVKYGRYRPDLPGRYDEVLGVELSSNNQYAVKIS